MHKVGVFEADDNTFDVVCSCGWHSTGWPAVRDSDTPAGYAIARAQQHADEHRTGKPAPELHEFRVAQGIISQAITKSFDTTGALHVIDTAPAEPAAAEDGQVQP